jgi:hypothetical protein
LYPKDKVGSLLAEIEDVRKMLLLEAGHHQMSVSDETIEESGWWLAYDD